MLPWKLELDEDYFRIFDSKKMVAGYFDPDYGDALPRDGNREEAEEAISRMLERHEPVGGGVVMFPMVKFGLFDSDLDTSIFEVEKNVSRVQEHLQKWRRFLASVEDGGFHSVRISHTDQDMLTIAFRVRFPRPVPLHRDELARGVAPTLEALQRSGLL